ncbi:hypothetical protein RRG08_059986 [Elysia crispata]|uniref:TIL domain-containing protein n=1 Tax=Elysia crispata TaxID=231223 RepID=A0AAE1AKP3_9GAST|nr:hypothetical protein RRG08_059986 [Elysia crispata]
MCVVSRRGAAECPANSHPTHRMTRCEPSCANPNPKGKCTRDTQIGCVCNEGFLLSDDKCTSSTVRLL